LTNRFHGVFLFIAMGRRLHFLFALILAFHAPANAQTPIMFEDQCVHNWTFRYGAQLYGLQQFTYAPTVPPVGGYIILPDGTRRANYTLAVSGAGRAAYTRTRPADYSWTIIHFGNHEKTFHTSVWPILAVIITFLAAFFWLSIFGIGSFTKRHRSRAPPDPSSPA
jgi:hypothetical protein